MRALVLLVVLLAGACNGASTSTPPTWAPASGSPTPNPTSAPASGSPTPTPTPIVLPSFAQLSAPSSNVVWMLVAGSRLFRSTDRGSTWGERSLPSGAQGVAISFVNEREGWIAPVDARAACVRITSLWHTSDGATTWTQIGPGGLAAPTCGGSISFAGTEHGFVAAIDERAGPVIYHTMDGGKTWATSGPIADPPGLPMQGGRPDLTFGTVRAFGRTLLGPARLPAPSGPSVHVYRSMDGGASWGHAAAVPSAGALSFVTATRWLRIGPGGASFETTDGGTTWHAYTTDYSQAAPIDPEIVFGDASVGYATVRGSLQRTLDGGAHWTTLRTPGTE